MRRDVYLGPCQSQVPISPNKYEARRCVPATWPVSGTLVPNQNLRRNEYLRPGGLQVPVYPPKIWDATCICDRYLFMQPKYEARHVSSYFSVYKKKSFIRVRKEMKFFFAMSVARRIPKQSYIHFFLFWLGVVTHDRAHTSLLPLFTVKRQIRRSWFRLQSKGGRGGKAIKRRVRAAVPFKYSCYRLPKKEKIISS